MKTPSPSDAERFVSLAEAGRFSDALSLSPYGYTSTMVRDNFYSFTIRTKAGTLYVATASTPTEALRACVAKLPRPLPPE